MNRLLGRCLLVLVVASPAIASAQTPVTVDRDIDAAVGSQHVVKRGSLASMGRQSVAIAGQGALPASEVAQVAFRDHEVLTGELRRGRAGLLADPVVETEVVETDGATILSSTTRAVITDADAVRRASPELASFRSGRGKPKLADLDAKTRKAFGEFQKRAQTFPATHPMKIAADKGEQALLDAVSAGLGDVAVTTTITIPKQPLARDAKGKALAPKRRADGGLELSATAVRKGELTAVTTRWDAPPDETTKGKSEQTLKFLTGFTEGESWEWSRRWDFATGGYFRVKASAWYAYGLRVPLEIEATLSPKTIAMSGGDADSEYEVIVKPKVYDAGSSFYGDTGLASSLVHGGDELVLDAGLQVTFTLHVLGTDINERLPKNDTFDFSQSFAPPFGSCGTSCGFNVWIPAEVTHTSVNILGIIKGSARAGVNVSGGGKASIDFEGVFADRATRSWKQGDKKNAKDKHTLSFTSASQQATMIALAPPVPGGSKSAAYGYELSNPRYDWTVVLTPGVRADIDIALWPIKETFSVKPLWIDALALKLGTIKLGPHDGTRGVYTVKHGKKSIDLGTQAQAAPSGAIGQREKVTPVKAVAK